MLAGLMDAAPPDRRPEWRELRGLVIGALRARAGADGRRTVWQSWRVALPMAALMLLIETAGDTLWERTFDQGCRAVTPAVGRRYGGLDATPLG